MKLVSVDIVMDDTKKKLHLGSLEDHNVKKSAHDMDEKLYEAGRKLKGRL